ncbi:MAG: Nucleolar protein 9 [Thelocarpon superellum]|nr:MAG: Nucleolar protein 9 [Thelocarpon superellum]
MPKENKKRGRREEKKEKKEKKKRKREEDHDEAHDERRRKSEDDFDEARQEKHAGPEEAAAAASFAFPTDGQVGPGTGTDHVFFGMLNDEEQEYFRRADEMLELNDFNDPEERTLFLANVYNEAVGKELKLACSQSCSRLLERLILLSTPAQLKTLFQKFSGHFLHLVRHRFASHCCEALFLQSAPMVSQELATPPEAPAESHEDEVYVSMENLFLYTLNDLDGHLGYLMADRHASHVLRVLLVVLSGRPLAAGATMSLLRSKRKETVEVSGVTATPLALSLEPRPVPDAFRVAIDQMVGGMMSSMSLTNLRLLAVHPSANPVLQLLVAVESSDTRKKRAPELDSIVGRLVFGESTPAGTPDTTYLRGLLYDPIGSRLFECILQHAPGKIFKVLYRAIFRDELGSLATNEVAGYVVSRALERLSREDLEIAVQSILPEVPKLVLRGRTSILRTMIDRSVAREAEMSPLMDALRGAYGEEATPRLVRMLQWEPKTPDRRAKHPPDTTAKESAGSAHGSLLAQSMLAVPGPMSALIYDGLLATPASTLWEMAERAAPSRVIQASLTLPTSSAAFRRKLINALLPHLASLATHSSGSYVLDALRPATQGLGNYAERVADQLLSHESQLRESLVGRAVWRNWQMDLYSRHRLDWRSKSRDTRGAHSPVLVDARFRSNGRGSSGGKTAIELAREKFAATKLDRKGRARPGAGGRRVS